MRRLGIGVALVFWMGGIANAQDLPQVEPLVDDEKSQTKGEPKPGAARGIVPPQLVQFVQASYPAEAQAQGIAGAIELEITILADGAVKEVSVVTGLGHGLDEAALEAAKQFKFTPAQKDGVAIPAKIRYRYVFELQPPPARDLTLEPQAPPEGALEGTLYDSTNATPLANAEIIATSGEKTAVRALSDAQGKFAIEHLPPGDYRVRVLVKTYLAFESKENIAPHEATVVTYRLSPATDIESFEAVARVEPPPREVTRRSIGKDQLTRIPGTRGDALRTIEILPGVGRPPFGSGLLLVRGSSPTDSQVFFEGVPIPLLYHFGGLTSFMNSRLIESIEFYPGNFSVRYGRKMGGVVDVQSRDPGGKKFSGVADINLLDSSLLLETPIGEDAGIAIAGRRSYIDFFFENVVPDDAFTTLAAPVYYDYQAIATYRPTPRDKLKLQFYASRDDIHLIFSDPLDSDPAIRGNVEVSTHFMRLTTQWKRALSKNVDQVFEISAGRDDVNFALGELQKFKATFTPLQGRAEWQARLSERVRLIGGLDVQLTPVRIDYTGPQPRQQEGDPGTGFSGDPVTTETILTRRIDTTAYRPAVYVETNVRPWDHLTLITGLRLDWYREIQKWSFDPRLAARYTLSEFVTLKSGVGMFSQPPEFQESSPSVGNPELKPIRSVHTSAGVEVKPYEAVQMGAEGFYKHLSDRVVGVPGGLEPYFINDGEGNIYGLELSGQANPKGRYFGYLSYTLMRSERQDRDEPKRLFDFDQTHILTLSAVYRLGRGWEAGATFRLVTGNPHTPIVGSTYNANQDIYQPIYGGINSARNPTFNRLDVRVEKKWRFADWNLAAYLDVQNVYNSSNPEGVAYSYNYLQTADITGVPFFPSLGLRGEL